MRKNLPVTDLEFLLSPSDSLVSVTDEKGRIVYCNPGFVRVSGYTREELLGQAHNLVRHPDMPPEAFRDMWATLKSGSPWTGYVKNRRKNGDFYWVKANATPMVSEGRITGYLSVRSCPERAACVAAEGLYAEMRRPGSKIRLEGGAVVGGGLLHRFGQLDRHARWLMGAALVWLAMLAILLAPIAAPTAAALAGLLAFGHGWFQQRRQQSALAGVLKDANRLAAGDLSSDIAVTGSGDIRHLQQALAQLTVNLRTVVGDTRSAVEEVMAAADEIAAGNMDLSERTESTASSLQETAASLAEINSTVHENSGSALNGSSLAQEMIEVANSSESAVRSMVETMGAISESAQRIRSFTTVIEGVAFQTNILSLNAAVEAARAGDAGRGFAVVASEVRALAQRTAEAARQIKLLVDESGQRIESGSQQSAGALRRVAETLSAIRQVDAVLNQIRAAAGQEELSISQINMAVGSLDDNTQQNAAMVEQLAGAAASLKQQVEEVMASMRLFRLGRNDGNVAQPNAVDLRRSMKQQAPRLDRGTRSAPDLEKRAGASTQRVGPTTHV